MSDEQAPEIPESPYGPAPDAILGASASTGDGPAAPPPAPAWVESGRRVLRLAAIITGLLAVLLTIVLIVLVALGEGPANNDIGGLARWLTDTLIFAAPVAAVVALNLLIWRALLRPLGRMSTSGRVALILLMIAVLAAVSVALTAVLLFAGFLAFGVLGSGF